MDTEDRSLQPGLYVSWKGKYYIVEKEAILNKDKALNGEGSVISAILYWPTYYGYDDEGLINPDCNYIMGKEDFCELLEMDQESPEDDISSVYRFQMVENYLDGLKGALRTFVKTSPPEYCFETSLVHNRFIRFVIKQATSFVLYDATMKALDQLLEEENGSHVGARISFLGSIIRSKIKERIEASKNCAC